MIMIINKYRTKINLYVINSLARFYGTLLEINVRRLEGCSINSCITTVHMGSID